MKQAEMSDIEVKNCENLAKKMPKWDDVVADIYKDNSSLAMGVLKSEIEEYEETGDISYVLKTIKRIAQAKSLVALQKESGLTRQAIYTILNGKVSPRLDKMIKLLRALGLGLYIHPLHE